MFPKRAGAMLILLISTVTSCSIGSDPKNPEVKYLQMQFVGPSASFRTTDTINIKLSSSCSADTLTYSVDKKHDTVVPYSDNLLIFASQFGIGYHSISASVGSCSSQVSFTILPSAPPATISYNIVNTFPHNTTSYTQGLVYESGRLFEGTGMYGQSKLMEMNIKSGNSTRSIDLDRQYFGEGVAMAGNKLYQLTWREKTGFIYNKEDFSLIKKFEYPTEGWGLAFNGTELILSDGSQYLYYLDTATMNVRKQIPVFDDRGPVVHLNELEWVDSYIYANVYMTNFIVKIDERTGAVIGRMDCSKLLTDKDKHPNIDVLNGIARNSDNGNYYITGKNWPKLFELELKEDEQ